MTRIQVLATDVYPERYGPGFGGAAADDWGPAITQALLDAQTAGTSVRLLSSTVHTYGIRTTPTWPTVRNGVPNPNLLGSYGQSKLKKLQDVSVLQFGGPNVAGMVFNSKIADLVFDGGNNAAWTTPLLINNWTESCRIIDCGWYSNFGPAISARGAWDTHYARPEIEFCGATDGVNPAVLLYSLAGDGGNATNNQWFENARIEDSRTGAIWAIGATASDPVTLTALTGKTKIEWSAGFTLYAPALKLVNHNYFSNEMAEISLGGSGVDSHQTTPFDGALLAVGSKWINLGRMDVGWGIATAAVLQSFFHFDATTTTMIDINWDNINLFMNGSQPTSVFKWDNGANMQGIRRGTMAFSGTFSAPMDSGALPSAAMVNLPSFTTSGGLITDAAFLTATGRNPINTDLAFNNTLKRLEVRINSVWQPAAFPTPTAPAANTHTVAAGSTTSVFTNTTFDGGTGTTAYTVGDLVAALKAAGVISS